MSGNGFVKVPTEELKRLRVDVYPEVNPITTFLKYKLLYTFKSPKSHQWYWVWVEVYQCDFYAVKFHLKAHRNSLNKYSLITGLRISIHILHLLL